MSSVCVADIFFVHYSIAVLVFSTGLEEDLDRV